MPDRDKILVDGGHVLLHRPTPGIGIRMIRVGHDGSIEDSVARQSIPQPAKEWLAAVVGVLRTGAVDEENAQAEPPGSDTLGTGPRANARSPVAAAYIVDLGSASLISTVKLPPLISASLALTLSRSAGSTSVSSATNEPPPTAM